MLARKTCWLDPSFLDGDGLPLQVADRPHPVRPEQLEAADMDAPSTTIGSAASTRRITGRRSRGSVGLARGEGFGEPGPCPCLDILYLGEPLAPQEFFGHVLGGNTDAGDLDRPDICRLRWWLCAHWPGVQAEQPCCACPGQPRPRKHRRVQPSACCRFIGTSSLASRSCAQRHVGASVEGLGRGVNHRAHSRTPVPATRSATFRTDVKEAVAMFARHTWPRPPLHEWGI